MEKKRCAACRKLFHPCPQSRGQKYCSAAECQRERKRRWQVAKRAGDPDYRDNDAQANRNWRTRHPDYWRAYRRTHPQSVLRNRRKQRERDRSRRIKPRLAPSTPHLANEDASSLQSPFETGTYRMIRVTRGDLANEDACLVNIALLSGA
jgi:hypothetical protein